MKIYEWNRSEALSNWSYGTIIVVADSLEEARKKAIKSFRSDSQVSFNKSFKAKAYYFKQFKKDLQRKPKIHKLNKTILITGGN